MLTVTKRHYEDNHKKLFKFRWFVFTNRYNIRTSKPSTNKKKNIR